MGKGERKAGKNGTRDTRLNRCAVGFSATIDKQTLTTPDHSYRAPNRRVFPSLPLGAIYICMGLKGSLWMWHQFILSMASGPWIKKKSVICAGKAKKNRAIKNRQPQWNGRCSWHWTMIVLCASLNGWRVPTTTEPVFSLGACVCVCV